MEVLSDLKKKAGNQHSSAVICSAEKGNPLIYASEDFQTHTGYQFSEIQGQNLRFLQGEKTEEEAVEKFRHHIANATLGSIEITNYRKSGELFLHLVEIRPVFDQKGVLNMFVAVQRKLEKATA